ncbi:MAG TPA: GNAT family N-acetyltransferase [Candidatus Dojkabacteria bacterium]
MLEIYSNQKEISLEFSTIIEADETMVEEAEWVAKQITESKTMLPKSTKEILQLFAEGKSILIVGDMGQPIAHGAVTFTYDDAKFLEVGGIIVDPMKRREGLGMLATEAAIGLASVKYPGWTKMALCNNASLPIFLNLGAEIVTFENLEIVPKEAWEACLTCPSYRLTKSQGKICCDTPVIIP